MTNRSKQTLQGAGRLATALGLALGLGGCGGGGIVETCPGGTTGSPPNCVSIEPPCEQTQLLQTPVMVPARWLIFDEFSVPEDGRLDVTLDWTNPESVMGFYLVPVGTCSLEEFNERACEFLIQGEPTSQKPRRMLEDVNAGNYRWIIGNFQDEEDESASLQIILSTGDCPVPTGAARTTSERARATTAPLEGSRQH